MRATLSLISIPQRSYSNKSMARMEVVLRKFQSLKGLILTHLKRLYELAEEEFQSLKGLILTLTVHINYARKSVFQSLKGLILTS